MTLTIGKFDGIHRGHQALLKRVMESERPAAVLTFSNHPAQVLHSEKSYPLIMTTQHKVKLLSEMGIDHVLCVPFTYELSELTPEEFLKNLLIKHPFKTLIGGYDIKIGKNRSGTKEVITEIGHRLGFNSEFLKPLEWKGKIVSSSLVRESLLAGNIVAASDWLGRPYSLYGMYNEGLDLSGLCLPPPGNYPVQVQTLSSQFQSIAHLTSNQLTLDKPLSHQWIDVIFE